ncbi:expressed protein [Chlorella variabilis]|uniref:Expressed protein n=1 Tax=Chlorella variabilis TaxID=554065 RepID=E1Z955_CHLVA|nr:expressed protein [Chlorella variabilis]EFN57719.1 expressed protein [Chlorella variabilis]|eukprot:XP_005849821.1 expressed protein [Chlorella variabilis]
MATDDDAEIARLLAVENPEQYYEYDFGNEEDDPDDGDDPDYGAGKKGGRKGKKKKAAEAGGLASAATGFDPATTAAAAAYALPAVTATGPAAAGAAPATAEAQHGMMVNGVTAMPGAALPGVMPGASMQIMLQQQALAAALAAGGGAGMTGLQIALPPGVSLEQASMMGLPIMALPVQLPQAGGGIADAPGSTATAATLPMAPGSTAAVLPRVGGVGGMPAAAAAVAKPAAGAGAGGGKSSDGDEFTATGRRKRKDTGKQRQQSRSWTDEEERLFLEALQLYGRDWKRCAEHVGTRDHRAFTSHAQKHFIKLLLRGEEVPPKVAETGRGYTLSGKSLDPNSAAARAYGLKPDLFTRIAGTGKLVVGVHVTTLDMSDGPPPQIQRSRGGKSPLGGGGGGGGKRQRRGKSSGERFGSEYETEEEDEDAFLASAIQGEVAEAAEPTEYVRNRPRRQVGRRMQLGETTESTDLTHLDSFVGPPGTGAPMAQPFQVTIDRQAVLVMDFHAHLSRCEIIGLLGGAFDAERRMLEIREAYPCRRAEGQASGTSVELCAESQVEVSGLMEERGQVPVGWYHSHPVFEPRPSQKDNENQRNYQALCRDAATGLEPWVGAIVGPYDQGLESASSQMQLWVVKMHNGELRPFSIRALTTGGDTMPTQHTEQAVAMALDQLDGDVGRVDLSEQWRPYSRLSMQQPEGPPLTKIQKLRESLAAHLPAAEHPAEQQAAAMPKLDDPEGYDLPSRQQFSMAVPGMLKQE